MNNRVYPKELYEKSLDDYLNNGKDYCPNCLTKSTTNINKHNGPPVLYIGGIIFCEKCDFTIFKKDLLTLQQVRESKIIRILD